jgi:[ribosomal protein S5]-alanine N-acetyltransferase
MKISGCPSIRLPGPVNPKTTTMVETSRLMIIPLDPAQLELYLLAGGKFEKRFELQDNGRNVSPEVKKTVVDQSLPKIKAAGSYDYLFITFWIVIEKASKKIVAELGFKGVPNSMGEIEIGYGTMHQERGNGYMTEAVAGMLTWAKTEPPIRWILAETEETNIPSIRIMEKNNFILFNKKENMLWWKIPVK